MLPSAYLFDIRLVHFYVQVSRTFRSIESGVIRVNAWRGVLVCQLEEQPQRRWHPIVIDLQYILSLCFFSPLSLSSLLAQLSSCRLLQYCLKNVYCDLCPVLPSDEDRPLNRSKDPTRRSQSRKVPTTTTIFWFHTFIGTS